ncbi:MAG: 16S rRNA pseudouridine(516) synthase, partial [Erysipelotrichales bacterium]|nr:16S rRNA pseudouridine(516) synthase [Erysipelotrichales bacterium]
MRLDKYLADMGIGTRSEIKKMIRDKRVRVSGEIIRSADFKVQENDTVTLDDEV